MPGLRADVDSDEVGKWVEFNIWRGDRCVCCAEMDDDLPFTEQLEIANAIAAAVNRDARGEP